jgi:hypothetical protein
MWKRRAQAAVKDAPFGFAAETLLGNLCCAIRLDHVPSAFSWAASAAWLSLRASFASPEASSSAAKPRRTRSVNVRSWLCTLSKIASPPISAWPKPRPSMRLPAGHSKDHERDQRGFDLIITQFKRARKIISAASTMNQNPRKNPNTRAELSIWTRERRVCSHQVGLGTDRRNVLKAVFSPRPR